MLAVLIKSVTGVLTSLFSCFAIRKEDRSEDDSLAIERILVLARNVLQVPRDIRSERRTDDDATVHDQARHLLAHLY